MAKQDLFGIEDDGDETTPYVILQIVPAEGWRAVFQEPTRHRTLGLAGFALVELIPEAPGPNQLPMRTMRPMVVDETGQIDDVEAFDDFICVVAPGADVHATISDAIRMRDAEEKASK